METDKNNLLMLEIASENNFQTKKEVNNTISIIIENYKIELSQKTRISSGKYLFIGHYEPLNNYSIYINNCMFNNNIKLKNLKEQLNKAIEHIQTEINIINMLKVEK